MRSIERRGTLHVVAGVADASDIVACGVLAVIEGVDRLEGEVDTVDQIRKTDVQVLIVGSDTKASVPKTVSNSITERR